MRTALMALVLVAASLTGCLDDTESEPRDCDAPPPCVPGGEVCPLEGYCTFVVMGAGGKSVVCSMEPGTKSCPAVDE